MPLPRQKIKIGWAHIDITPLQPVQNWGWSSEIPSNGNIVSRLFATAMAVQSEQADMCSMIISCDLGTVNFQLVDELRDSVTLNDLPGFDLTGLFLIATHTHCGPFIVDAQNPPPPGYLTGSQYRTFLLGQLKQVAIDAWNNRVFAAVSAVQGTADVGACRIWSDPMGKHHFVSEPFSAGWLPISNYDHMVNLLYTYDMAGNLNGVVVNTSCPAQDFQGVNATSADYWSEVRTQLTSAYQPNTAYPNIHVLPMLSFVGDQGPWDVIHGDSNGNNPARMTRHATAIANTVAMNLASATATRQSEVELQHVVSTQHAATKPGWVCPRDTTWPDGFCLRQGATLPPGISLTYFLHTVRIKNVAIVNNPCEMFIDYAYALRRQSYAPIVFLAQLSSDDYCYVPYCVGGAGGYYLGNYPGYVPTESSENAAANGNGVYSERVTEGCVGSLGGKQMVDAAVAQINALFPPIALS